MELRSKGLPWAVNIIFPEDPSRSGFLHGGLVKLLARKKAVEMAFYLNCSSGAGFICKELRRCCPAWERFEEMSVRKLLSG